MNEIHRHPIGIYMDEDYGASFAYEFDRSSIDLVLEFRYCPICGEKL